ncbi:uncharacterized protein LOC144115517 [Amblyomma americanum]
MYYHIENILHHPQDSGTPDCIVCHGAHSTGSRNCKFRLARQQPTGLQQSNEDKSQTGKEERRSRPRKRSSSGERGDSKSRDRSASFPPLPGPEPGKGGGQGSGHGRSPSATRKKVSWPNAGSQNETAREKELQRQVLQQAETIKKMEARIAEMERALKTGRVDRVQTPLAQAPQQAAQANASRVDDNTAMEVEKVENRGTVKRPPPADEGARAKRVAETSAADTPQPVFTVTCLKRDMLTLAERVGKLEERQDRLDRRVDKIEARLGNIEERLDAFTNDMRGFQTQVIDMFKQLNAMLEVRLPPVVGQEPMLENLGLHHGPSPAN